MISSNYLAPTQKDLSAAGRNFCIVTAQDSSPPSVVRTRVVLRAVQPVAAPPAGKKTRAAGGGEESGT